MIVSKKRVSHWGACLGGDRAPVSGNSLGDDSVHWQLDEYTGDSCKEEFEMLGVAGERFDGKGVLAGDQPLVFSTSAKINFGI
jgi:peptide subunit release factor RF-3